MLDFLITVFGGAYLGGKYLKNKNASERACWDAWNKRVSIEGFEARNTNREMEKKLVYIMKDPAYQDEIKKEVSSALKQIIPRHDNSPVDYEVALDILLANRGKISRSSVEMGYTAYGVYPQLSDKLVEWIRRTLNNRGVPLELERRDQSPMCRHYVWVGSYASTLNC